MGFKISAAHEMVLLKGGDGGNRTRVRKNRPSKIYKLSSHFMSRTAGVRTNLMAASRWDPKALFRMVHGRSCGTLTLFRLLHLRSESGAGRRDLTRRSGRFYPKLMQRGGERCRKCVRHLIFCADLTRSAPLGLHSGDSLSRRSLSSP